MKQLTPSGWIGVLIGIIVFGSIVGLVKGNVKKCPADPNAGLGVKKFLLTEMTSVFDKTNFGTQCSSSHLCLQYVPPPRTDTENRKGKASVLAECAAACSTGQELADKIGKGYTCKTCDVSNDATTCKFIADIKRDLTECYDYNKSKTTTSNAASTEKKHLCMDECHYFYTSAKDILTVGCQDDIKNTPGLNAAAGLTTTKCPDDDANCEKMISLPLCFAKTGSKLETVEDITKAMARENWKVPCANGEKCIQYYPPNDKQKRLGKAKVLVECGTAPVTGDSLIAKIGDGYLSHACDVSGFTNCKTLKDVNSETVECYDYTGDKNTADATTLKQKKIYCMDKCRYEETGRALKVNCGAELKNGSPADCPDTDKLCEKND